MEFSPSFDHLHSFSKLEALISPLVNLQVLSVDCIFSFTLELQRTCSCQSAWTSYSDARNRLPLFVQCKANQVTLLKTGFRTTLNFQSPRLPRFEGLWVGEHPIITAASDICRMSVRELVISSLRRHCF